MNDIDRALDPLACIDCEFIAKHPQGLGRHRTARHGVPSKTPKKGITRRVGKGAKLTETEVEGLTAVQLIASIKALFKELRRYEEMNKRQYEAIINHAKEKDRLEKELSEAKKAKRDAERMSAALDSENTEMKGTILELRKKLRGGGVYNIKSQLSDSEVKKLEELMGARNRTPRNGE